VCAAAAQADRLACLVGQLLDVSRATAGQLHLDRHPTDIGALAREVAGRFANEAEAAGSSLDVHAEESVIGAWDALRLEQVLTNLVSNAVKFGAGKPVEVRVCRVDRSARLIVCDHGIGIARKDLDRIFRFERTAEAAAYSGLGMGLYLVRQIVEAHGGTIRVESAPNAGSTFIAQLPIEPPAAERST
jgi:signal transduction histidine kinase